jgi:hypothetical protein
MGYVEDSLVTIKECWVRRRSLAMDTQVATPTTVGARSRFGRRT